MIFFRDTVLYHPTAGRQVFPQGEQHPGPAWFDNPECVAASANAPELARQLEAANNAVNRLQGELDAANSQVIGQARAHEAELQAAHDRAVKAADEYGEHIARLEADIEKLIAQRDAVAKPKVEPVAAPISLTDNDGDGKPGGSEPDPAAETAEKGKIRAEIKALGFGTVPGPRASVDAFREALAAARSLAQAAE